MKIKFTLAIASFLTAALQLNAQSKNNISGLVKDNSNNPIQSVTVSLLKAKDSSLVKADVTDKAGSYEIAAASNGTIFIKL